MTTRTITVPLATLLAVGAFAGCGDSETTADSGSASDASDAQTVTGDFALVADAPKGFEEVTGTATMVRNDSGTDASIELAGLKPDLKYVSHIHAGSCDQADPGGPHFKFDAAGADKPPNEIHLPFTSDAEGNGTAEAHNDKVVPAGEGQSLVVHEAPAGEDGHADGSGDSDAAKEDSAKEDSAKGGHSHAQKIACAPLDPGSESGGASPGPATETTPPAAESEALAIEVKDGKPVGGVKELSVKKGDDVRFAISSDKKYEIHAHGYDIHMDAGPGKPARFDFPAKIEGIFEVEVEETGTQVVKLTVNPS